MSKYYKAEDVIDTLANQWHFEAQIECPYAADDIEEWKQNARELFADLPTIEVSEDCISRDWVLNRLTKYQKDYTFNELDDWQNTVVEWITMDINDAPSVVPSCQKNRQVERAEGEWIDKGDYAECSNCGANSGTQFDGVEPVPCKTKFCPGCGAKMKGE